MLMTECHKLISHHVGKRPPKKVSPVVQDCQTVDLLLLTMSGIAFILSDPSTFDDRQPILCMSAITSCQVLVI